MVFFVPKHMKGKDCFDFSLQPFCQKIYRTSELTGDDVVVVNKLV